MNRVATLRVVALTYGAIFLRTCLPLVILPLLSRRLGTAEFGVALTVQSLALLGSILTAYGFQTSAAGDISTCRTKNSIGNVVSRVLSAQLLLGGVTSFVVVGAAMATPALRASPGLVIMTGVMAVAAGFSPMWYFQGRGRMALGIMLDALGQIAALAGVFFFVAHPSDTGWAILAMITGQVITLLICAAFMRDEVSVGLVLSVRQGVQAIRDGFHLFLVRAGSASYTVSGVWLVSIMSTPTEAAYYGVAAKIGGALLLSFAPLAQIAMPRATQIAADMTQEMVPFAAKWAVLILACALGTCLFVELFMNKIIVALFSEAMQPAVFVTKLLALVLIPNAMGQVFGSLILLPLRCDRWLSRAVLAGAVVNFALALPLAHFWGAEGMASGRLISECVITLIMLFAVWKIVPVRDSSHQTAISD